MKQLLLSGFCWVACVATVQAQAEDYYRPRKRSDPAVLLHNPDLIRHNDHWYIGVEGGGKWNDAVLTNTVSGLLVNQKGYTDSYAGAYVGYARHLRWALEAGYLQNPSNALLAVRASPAFSMRINDLQHTIPVRFKWRLLRIGVVQKRSGLYAGAGLWWTPGRRREEITGFRLSGLSRATGTGRRYDTLLVENQSFTTGRAKLELEGSLEFTGRIAKRFELVTYGRVIYAGASALRSDTELFVNGVSEVRSVLTLRPVSYQFGLAVRYLFLRDLYQSKYDR